MNLSKLDVLFLNKQCIIKIETWGVYYRGIIGDQYTKYKEGICFIQIDNKEYKELEHKLVPHMFVQN